MPTLNTVLQAVKYRLLTTPQIVAVVSQRIWLAQAPEKTVLPHIVIRHEGEVPNYSTQSVREVTTLSFVCASTPLADDADALVDLIKGVFNPDSSLPNSGQDLAINGATTTYLRQKNYVLNVSPSRAPSGEFVFEGELSYDVMIAKAW